MNINLGPLALQWAHVLALLCGLIASGVGWIAGRRLKVGISDVLLDMALVALIAGRVAFVALWANVYLDAPWSIFDIRDGGIEPWLATLAALSVAAWRVHQLPNRLWPLISGLCAGLAAWYMLMFSGFTGEPPDKRIPTLNLTTLDGTQASLASAAQGRAMVVNMWATWCPPCRQEMPALARTQARRQDVVFVFVNQGESLEVVRRYLPKTPMRPEHVYVDPENLLGKAMKSSALPTTLIYGPDGQLRYSHQGLISEAVLLMQLDRCCQVQR